jgi:hypothetical protein
VVCAGSIYPERFVLSKQSKVPILPWGFMGDKQSREMGKVRSEKVETLKSWLFSLLSPSFVSLFTAFGIETCVAGETTDEARQINGRERAT